MKFKKNVWNSEKICKSWKRDLEIWKKYGILENLEIEKKNEILKKRDIWKKFWNFEKNNLEIRKTLEIKKRFGN